MRFGKSRPTLIASVSSDTARSRKPPSQTYIALLILLLFYHYYYRLEPWTEQRSNIGIPLSTETAKMSRALSIRSKKTQSGTKSPEEAPKHRFTMATLRGLQQPEMSRKLFKLIKTENEVIGAHENAARERIAVASQLSDWGEGTGDDAISDISDKLGVLLSELGEQEDAYATNLEDSRGLLKQIRNMEQSVQPSRNNKAKIMDDIAKLKHKEPESAKIPLLEQELVRAEAQSLVAEAQLTNVTRQKLKEAYDLHFAATIERAEKQALLARQGRRLLNLLDDTPVVPGDAHPTYGHEEQGHTILAAAEADLREWSPNLEPVHSQAQAPGKEHAVPEAAHVASPTSTVATAGTEGGPTKEGAHLAQAGAEREPAAA